MVTFLFLCISDKEAPVIYCPHDKLDVPNDLGKDNAVVTWDDPAVTDNSGRDVQVVCDPPSGSVFPIGVTIVTCTATDTAGNTAYCQFKVVVVGRCEMRPWP